MPTTATRPTSTQRLLTRLAAMGLPVTPDSQIERTYAGSAQRANGAWSWFVILDGGHAQIGSQTPVAALLRETRLIATRHEFARSDISIDAWAPTDPRFLSLVVACE